MEYKTWMSGKYFLHKPAHSSLVFSKMDAMPSHAAFNDIAQAKGVAQSVTVRMQDLRSISESERSIEGAASEDEGSTFSSDDEVYTAESSGVRGIVKDYEGREEYHKEIMRRSSSVVNMNDGPSGIAKQSSVLADLAVKAAEHDQKQSPPKESRRVSAPKLTPSSSRKAESVDKFLNLEDDMDTKAVRGDSFRSSSPESKKRGFKHKNKSLANLLSEEAKKSPQQGFGRKVIEFKMNSDGGALKLVDLAVDRSDSAVTKINPKARLVKMQTSSDVIHKATSEQNMMSGGMSSSKHRVSF